MIGLGAASCGAFAWRMGTELRLTVIVKASFEIVPDAPMKLGQQEEIIDAEVHHRNVPSQSVRLTSDLVPYLPAADVVLTGHAHAPEGTSVQALTVRLAVFREALLAERVIHVYGSRAARGGQIVPFERMPLVYERTFGGSGDRDNPFGTGVGASDSTPNLVDPSEPRKAACFAPISAAWPVRRRLLGGVQLKALKQQVPEVLAEAAFEYFHAAPPEQRIAGYLNGNEWIVLDGMHASHPSVKSRLPDAYAGARVVAPGEPVESARRVELVADMLRIDADAMTCSLVWRGQLPIADEATLATLAVVGGVAVGGAPIAWPARIEPESLFELLPASSHQPSTISVRHPMEGTLALTVDETPAVRALPFANAPPLEAAPPPPRQEPPRAQPRPPAGDGRAQTLNLTPEEAPVPRRAPMPFQRPAQAPAAPAAPFAPVKSPEPVPTPVAPTPVAPPPVVARSPSTPPARRAASKALGVDILPDAPLTSIALVPWGPALARDTVTVVVKATCDLVPGRPAVPRATADAPSAEVMAGSPPRCVYPSDLVPYKVRADVVLVGHAVAPGGSATSMEVSFGFGADGQGFLRRVQVFGDRRWEKARIGVSPTPPEPFTRMPIIYARAFGGPRFAPNPDGIGHHARCTAGRFCSRTSRTRSGS
jgi:hypothetical protein